MYLFTVYLFYKVFTPCLGMKWLGYVLNHLTKSSLPLLLGPTYYYDLCSNYRTFLNTFWKKFSLLLAQVGIWKSWSNRWSLDKKGVKALMKWSCLMFRSAEWHFETEAGNGPHEHHPDPAQLLCQVHHLCHREAGPKVSIPHRSSCYSF